MGTRPRFDLVGRAAGLLGQRLLKLPPAISRDVTVERDLRIPTHDGQTLLANHWAPAGGDGPTAVIRSPYGRRGPLDWLYGRALAERGLHVLTVSCRGTFGSDGDFRAMRHEREDGLSVLRWLAGQPWVGDVVLTGSSYLGYTQWAVAAEAPVRVRAMVPHVTSSRLALSFLRPDRFEVETLLDWSVSTATQERPGAMMRALLGVGRKRVRAAMSTLPLVDADTAALGRRWPFYQDCLHHDQDDPFWSNEDHSPSVGDVTVPVSSIAGWYDIFLADQLRDYKVLAAAGREAHLTVGPWWHGHVGGMAAVLGDTVGWAAAHARGTEPPSKPPVRLFVMGVDEWRDFEQWPPTGYTHQRWHLAPGGELRSAPGTQAPPTSFTYDPADPTPSLGGPKLESRGAGPVDNRELEARDDVLVFTSDVLDADVEVIGEVTAEVWLRADRPSCDLFVRLCDVDGRGKSLNVCDDLVKVRPDGVTKVTVELSPTAHVFRRGHRIRVQVSAGAFPRFARNLGDGGPAHTATELVPTGIEVFHDADRPSAILLPRK
ncbi:X-Pro dipeptidyl-peptidase [Lentzea pudingi]|uniref:X-Pro dipeptidyl-peptidase n=1 Tax=Lentzea pudingi TaxID=1789439 RepID=A0ABQ2HDH4_9PSEU|nr:CocE/NonD family hydrolase [Lentzea pudingi]GGM75456.1 X-Pro dipeptidyl-peptidase [Lentzea pudingi]